MIVSSSLVDVKGNIYRLKVNYLENYANNEKNCQEIDQKDIMKTYHENII